MTRTLLFFSLLTLAACRDKDGLVDSEVDTPVDADGDGFDEEADCNDNDAAVFPGAEEVCDGLDNDCDGAVDAGAVDAGEWYMDADADGHGDPGTPTLACEAPAGHVASGDDCDDANPETYPGASERCDELDNDCDGEVDEEVRTEWYADADADGFGDAGATLDTCDAPEGYTDDATDCDDGDAAVFPGAEERCNGVDDDCDSVVDEPEAVDAATWYADADADGYGDLDFPTASCEQPSGYVSDATDCDDGAASVNPGATELCNGVDDDCDSAVDEPDAADAATWYADADGDSYGDPGNSQDACAQPSGFLSDDSDCDDSDPDVYPGAPELRDGLDNDCDGSADDDLSGGTGLDGNLTVTGTTDLSTTISGSRTEADAASYRVTAISGADVVVDGAPAGLSPGDEVLLINLQGSDAAHAAVGIHEFATVSSVSGSTVTLAVAVAGTYGESSNTDLSDQVIVLQRVPNYDVVTVSSGGVLTTSPWTGAGGGVLAFRAAGGLTVDAGGVVSVDGLGYAGGDTGQLGYNCDAYQGESYAGPGSGEYNGTCAAYNEATGEWAPNYGGGGAHICGGGGNHAGGATASDSWNGGGATPAQAGLTYGEAQLGVMFMGSGGGGVWNGTYNCNGSTMGPGGDGAGILFVGASSITAAGAGAFTAVGGSSDACAQGTWTYGAGGGAGGTIWLAADTVSLASDALDAQGGFGNSLNIRHGGDGGYGRVRVDCTTCNGYGQGSADAASALAAAAEPDPGHSALPE